MIRRLLPTAAVVLACLAAMCFADTSSAAAITFENTPPSWIDRWAQKDDAPLATARVYLMDSWTFCGFPVGGCSSPGADVDELPDYNVYANTRNDFYFEMGHIFDWSMLTGRDRQFLARKWGVPHWHWWDTPQGLVAGAEHGIGIEDGLEGMFSVIYQECAWGHSTLDTSYATPIPDGVHVNTPSIYTGSFNTCAYIRRIADSSTHAPEARSGERVTKTIELHKIGTRQRNSTGQQTR